MRIVLLGAPGAGKGTQCKYIVEKYGLVHLSSGDILRQNRKEDTDLGKKAQSYMDAGELVPDDLIIEMMIGEIAKAGSGVVLDGFPRTLNQAKKLDEALTERNEGIDAVFNLIVDDEVVIERITGRRSCPQCGAVYHVKNLKPKIEGKCDNDEVELVQRPDDTVDVIKNRLKNYYELTAPLVDYYKDKAGFCDFDAGDDAEVVRQAMYEKLDALS